jgi:hypothetical protein
MQIIQLKNLFLIKKIFRIFRLDNFLHRKTNLKHQIILLTIKGQKCA